MKKIVALLIALGLTSVFAADANKTAPAKAEKKVEKNKTEKKAKAEKNKTEKKAKAEKKEANKTK